MSRTILVQEADGEQYEVSNIPDEAKITFAATNPASDASRQRIGRTGYTLRIYRGAKADNGNQLAVFQEVLQFRDLTLNVKRIGKKTWIDDDIPHESL